MENRISPFDPHRLPLSVFLFVIRLQYQAAASFFSNRLHTSTTPAGQIAPRPRRFARARPGASIARDTLHGLEQETMARGDTQTDHDKPARISVFINTLIFYSPIRSRKRDEQGALRSVSSLPVRECPHILRHSGYYYLEREQIIFHQIAARIKVMLAFSTGNPPGRVNDNLQLR
jgi:hypothetical protein